MPASSHSYPHSQLLVTGISMALTLGSWAQSAAPAARQVDCSVVLAKLRADFAKEPGRLILSVEDALTTSEVCACPIVRSAVSFARGNGLLTGQIVVAAIRMVPAASARITECALTEAPEAALAVRTAIAAELGADSAAWLETAPSKSASGSSPAVESAVTPSGKSVVGKAPAALPGLESGQEESDEEFWPSPGITGIFLTIPASVGVLPATEVEKIKFRHIITTKRPTPPRRPVAPVTRSLPE